MVCGQWGAGWSGGWGEGGGGREREREREIGRSEETSGIELARVSCLSARCESARSVLTAVSGVWGVSHSGYDTCLERPR